MARLRPQSGLPDILILCFLYLDLVFLSAMFLWTNVDLDNVIGVVTRIRAGRSGVRIPAGVKYSDWLWGHPAPYSVGFRGSIPDSNATRPSCWPILQRLKISGACFHFYFACLVTYRRKIEIWRIILHDRHVVILLYFTKYYPKKKGTGFSIIDFRASLLSFSLSLSLGAIAP